MFKILILSIILISGLNKRQSENVNIKLFVLFTFYKTITILIYFFTFKIICPDSVEWFGSTFENPFRDPRYKPTFKPKYAQFYLIPRSSAIYSITLHALRF